MISISLSCWFPSFYICWNDPCSAFLNIDFLRNTYQFCRGKMMSSHVVSMRGCKKISGSNLIRLDTEHFTYSFTDEFYIH